MYNHGSSRMHGDWSNGQLTLVILRESSPSSLRPSEDQSICIRMPSYKRLARSPPCWCCSRSTLCIWDCCGFSQTSRQSHVMSAWGNFPCKRLGLAVSLFCWARARAFNLNKSSVGRAVAFGRATLTFVVAQSCPSTYRVRWYKWRFV